MSFRLIMEYGRERERGGEREKGAKEAKEKGGPVTKEKRDAREGNARRERTVIPKKGGVNLLS